MKKAYFIPIEAGFKVLLIIFYSAFYSISDDPAVAPAVALVTDFISSHDLSLLDPLKSPNFRQMKLRIRQKK